MSREEELQPSKEVRGVFDPSHESFGRCLYTTAKLLQSLMEEDAKHLTGIPPNIVDDMKLVGAGGTLPLSEFGPTGLTMADKLKGGLKVIRKRVHGIEGAGLRSISGEKLMIYLYCLSIEFYLKSNLSDPPKDHNLAKLAMCAKQAGLQIEAHESIMDLWEEHGHLLHQIRYYEDAQRLGNLLTQIEQISTRLYET